MPYVTDPGGLDEVAHAPKSGKKIAVAERVCALVTEIWGYPTGYVTPHSHLLYDIGEGSLNILRFYMKVKKEFGVQLLFGHSPDLCRAQTVGDLIVIIEAHAK